MKRHICVIVLGALLLYVFLAVHSAWAPTHRWNRAFADVSPLLLAITMLIGPMARLWRAWKPVVPWRRAFGIHALVFSAIHVFLVLELWIAWEMPRLFGLLVHPLRGEYVMVEHGFGLANVLGMVALAYGAVLMIISNEYAVQRLGGSVWKFIQRGTYVLWMIAVIHTAYFLFMHFLHFDRPIPDPNPLRWPFVSLVVAVTTVRWMATARIWRLGRSEAG